MSIEGEKKVIKEGDQVKQILTVSFSNGALEQLESLKKFLGTDDPVEVVKAGIAFVQRIKETEEAAKAESTKSNVQQQ